MKRVIRKRVSGNFPMLLSTREAARLLHLHVNTVRRWSNRGLLKTYRLGPRADRRFDRRDVTNLLHRTQRRHNT